MRKRNIRRTRFTMAKRTEQSICEQYASKLKIGDKFKYKDFACTVTALTKNVITFVGVRDEKIGAVSKEMRLNAESFNTAVEERRIKLVNCGRTSLSA